MKRRRIVTLAAWVSCIAVIASLGCRPGAGKTAFVGATLIDGTGAPPLPDAVILVADGHIEELGPSGSTRVPRGAERIDLAGRWVIPGLIDGHAHVEEWALSRFLAYGVTSVRDMGGWKDSIVAIRDSVSLGVTLGPRMYISGSMIDAQPPTRESATGVRTPTQARQAVDDRVLSDVSQIKVYTRLERRLLTALLDEARALQTPVAAHLGKVDALTAARMGVRSLEHMSGVVEATVANPQRLFQAHSEFFPGWNMFEREWSRLDSAALDRTARALAETGVAVVPTLALHEAYAHLNDEEHIASLDLAGVPQGAREAWDLPDLIRRARLSSRDFTAFRRSRPVQDLFVRLFDRAGGLLIAGSDASNQLLPPGSSLHRELALLVAAGLDTQSALLAATRNAAQVLGADSIGTLEAGTVADFVVLTGDPLADIANVGRIERVILRGRVLDPADLRAGW